MRGAMVVVALCSSGCGSSFAFLSSTGYASLILLEVSGPSARATAYDLMADPAVKRTATEGADEYAYEFEATLDALAIPPGDLTLGTTGSHIPHADRWEKLSGSTWTELTALPAAIEDLRSSDINPCATFDAISRSLPRLPKEYATFALALDADRVFVGTSTGAFYIVTAEATQRLTALSTTTPHAAGAQHGAEIWLVDRDGRVAHGDPDHGFVPGPPLPFHLLLAARMDASPADQPLELLVTDETLAVAHFDGERWTQIRTATGLGASRGRAGIAWAEANLGVLIGGADDAVIEISSQGTEHVERLDVPVRQTGDNVWTVSQVRGVGLVAGTRYDVVFRRSSTGWDRLAEPTLNPVADVLFGLGDGDLLAGGEGGVYIEWRSDGQVCEPISGLGRLATHVIAPLGDGFMTLSDASGEMYTIVVATRRR